MTKKFVLTCGLPRAGTTLLGTVLNQNPNFHASISGPLARFVRAIIQESSSQGGYRHECPPEKRKQLIAGLFDNYHDTPDKTVFFNHNRGWPLLLPTVKDLYPNTKVLMCVRDIGWILDSFETLFRKNPYSFTSMFSGDENASVYSRCETLLNPGRTLGFAYTAVKQAITCEHKHDIMTIEYETLCRYPEMVMKSVYNFIEEPYYEHDFNDVAASYDEFDEDINLPGSHTTRKKLEWTARETVIPPDLWQRVAGMEVWR